MYVLNANSTNVKKFYCKRVVAEYLSKNGIPIYGKEGGFYIFVETEKLMKVFEDAPDDIKRNHELTKKREEGG